jgi:ribose 5-phosphate isomerase B
MTNQSPLLIAADHAGFELKEQLKKLRPDLPWEDLGPATADRVDYPDYAYKVASRIQGANDRGVLICGSGQGMMIGANRFKKVRAALAWIPEIAKLSRSHNDANVLCLAARFTSAEAAAEMLDIFLKTEFEGGRHQDRVTKLTHPVGC